MQYFDRKNKVCMIKLLQQKKPGHVVICRDSRITDGPGKEFLFDKLRCGCVGGIQAPSFVNTKEFISEIKAAAPNPILVCADMEHGVPCPGAHKLPYKLNLK